MRIVYNIPGTWRSGGMERVLSGKVNWLVSHGHDVTVITTDQRGHDPFYPLDSRVRCLDLGIDYETNNGSSLLDKLLHFPYKQWKHRKKLKKVLSSIVPDVTVSMFCNDAPLIPSLPEAGKKVLEVHFSRDKRLQFRRGGLWSLVDKARNVKDGKTARLYDRFVVLTEEDRPSWGELENILVIPNPSPFRVPHPNCLDSKVVFSAGRLGFQKGYERLIDAWSAIVDRFPDWKLIIAGEGEEKDKLESQIRECGMERSVSLIGATNDIRACYEKASVVALSSRFEGLPMLLLEAQSFGLPLVAFQCKCGPKDIITDGVDGFLVPEGDSKALSQKLATVMADDKLRNSMGKAAYKSSFKYDEDVIMNQWERLFYEITSGEH